MFCRQLLLVLGLCTAIVQSADAAMACDLGCYENSNASPVSANWDPLMIQPDLHIPEYSFCDSHELVLGITPCDSLSVIGCVFRRGDR